MSAPPARGGSLPHFPALDGLRGLAVLGVLAFHAGIDRARGGFLGVSLFFTLSGFLITSSLLAEQQAEGRVHLLDFWARRARRLLPAALVTLAGVALLAPRLATPEQLAALRGDLLAALGYVSNWRFLLDGRSYRGSAVDGRFWAHVELKVQVSGPEGRSEARNA